MRPKDLAAVYYPGTLLACLGMMMLCAPVSAAEPGTITGTLTFDGTVYPLQHVYVWQPPLQDTELWIFLTDRPLPPAAAEDDAQTEQLARDNVFGGIKLVIDPLSPRLDDIRGVVYAPTGDGFSLDQFNFGPSWQTLEVRDRRVTGTLRTGWMSWTLEAEFNAPVEGSTGNVTTLTAAEAQTSPQADVLIAFEQALVEQGIDAAGAWMTADKLADMRAALRDLGEDSFKEFQASQRANVPMGEARREQIERVNIDGDYAEVGAVNGDFGLHVARLLRSADGWKISQW